MNLEPLRELDVDALAQEIRRVDGDHKLGAAELAEALMPYLSRALAQLDDGWVLVPREPTDAMRNAWEQPALDYMAGDTKCCGPQFATRYRAMLAAASPLPSPPAQEPTT